MDAQYETDFVAWTAQQASLLHAHRFELEGWGIDVANLVDEVETLGRSEHRELRSRLETLLIHLLKWQYQPKRQGSSWSDTILEQRHRLDDILNASPSLRRALNAEVKDVYPRARHRAAVQTRLPSDTFPVDCSCSIAQVLDVDFWP